ncbi:MAG: PspC domain-containing protein [Ekhidna sp.]|uniref:PspC domain-containing protein n=1 Tax=Ekhidna sp. TaxID=2608089 RepID=UPI0032ED971F
MTKRLFRSNDRMLGGVCAGLAEYLGWDPTLVRIAYIILSIASIGFPGMLVYIILWIVMPPRY